MQVLEGHEVIDLTTSSDGSIVTGVRIRQRNYTAPEAREPIVLAADLSVIEAAWKHIQEVEALWK